MIEEYKIWYSICIVLFLFFSSDVGAVQNTEQQNISPDTIEMEQDIIIQNPIQNQNEPVQEKKSFPFISNPLSSNRGNSIKTKESATTTDALNVSLGLIFILIIIFSLAWFMKKMGYSNLKGQRHLKILSTLNLGQKEKIALIQVGKQQLLVGMTATQINTLHVLDEPITESEVQENNHDIERGNSFSDKLSEYLLNKK